MLDIIICDDEKVFCQDLKQIIGTELDLSGISYRMTQYSCGEDLLENYSKHSDKQIIFLDIEMKQINGMETAKKIRQQNSIAVIIFVTSYTDFVFEGYEVKARGYILKPYQKNKILELLHTALLELDLLEEACYLLEQRTGSIRLPYSSICYFYSKGHLLYVVTTDQTYSFYGKLNDLTGILPPGFVRIHNRYLINLKFLQTFCDNKAVVSGTELPISRSKKQDLSIAYAKYILQ